MAKKTISKKEFSLDSISDRFSSKSKYKPDTFIDLGKVFQQATGVPGPAIGHLNVFLGHSDTGKTTALIKSAIWCQKNGILPIFIITWNRRFQSVSIVYQYEYRNQISWFRNRFV